MSGEEEERKIERRKAKVSVNNGQVNAWTKIPSQLNDKSNGGIW